MDWNTWLLYALAVSGLSLTPGPNSLLVIAHGALHGRGPTRWTIAGGAVGFTGLIALAMAGIGALLQTSPGALTALKFAGGAYLVWLGVQLWRAPPLALGAAVPAPDASAPDASAPRPSDPAALREGQPAARANAPSSRALLFRQGLFAAVSNPKVLLFYGAFLPQFISPARSLWLQFAVMALTFVVAECAVEYGLASLSHRIRPWLERSGRRFNQVCGVLFAVIGAALPFAH
ncbi:lysine transporter LysE [Bordetella genomosp. 5]|uniref:LysE family translocator n=1 Tax=Bordetella genomosp. 5 TaxID=1395608 RepID=UPI000B9DFD7F|nr:LysE family translocator [Bordetella genomosp. 5]OZI46049.1 lysine transporter LysE [Bordetella genomosp. 5]